MRKVTAGQEIESEAGMCARVPGSWSISQDRARPETRLKCVGKVLDLHHIPV